MKKLFYCAAALATLLFAGSCQRENLEPAVEGATVTYTVKVPEAIATKAIGDEITAVDKVYFEVYRAGEVDDLTKAPVYQGDKPVTNNVASFDLEFVKGQNFVVLFWAQNSSLVKTSDNPGGMYDINDLRAIKLVNPGASNNAAAQVFAGKDTVSDCVSAAEGNVTLTRPVSQINVYTTTESLSFGDVTIGLDKSSMTVAGLYNTYNVAAGYAVEADENKATFAYAAATVPTVAADNTDLTYVAMNYVGFAPNAGATVTVDFTIKTTEANDISHSVSNVPVKPNYRTNIVGNLITEAADYNVTLDADWVTPDLAPDPIYLAAAFGGEVTLTENVVLTSPLEVKSEMTINLNGKTISGDFHKSVGAIIKNSGTLTITGGVITSTGDNGGSAVQNSGTMTIMDVTLNGAPNANGSWPSYTVNNTGKLTITNSKITSHHGAVASYGEGAIVTLNDSEIDMEGIAGYTSHGIYTYNSGKVIVNGGTYANKATDQAASGASVINGAVEVNSGDFSGRIENYYGTPVLKGGSYSVKPNTNFIAAGYKAVSIGDRFYVLPEVVANAATDANVTAVTKSTADVATALGTDNGEATMFMWNDVAYIAKYGEVLITSSADEATTSRGVVEYATGLTSATVAEGIEVVGNRTFRQCKNLETVVLPNTLTEIGPAVFQTCSKLANVTIPATVTAIGEGAFAECTSLTSINIPNGITRLEKDVLRNTGLTAIEIPASVNYIGTYAFRDCKQLTEVIINAPEFTMEGNTFGIMAAPFTPMTIHVANAEMKAYVESKLTAHAKTYITVVAPTVTDNTADLQAALAGGKNVVLANDLTITPEEMPTAPYGNKMALSHQGGVFDGNGKSISVTANGDNYVVMTNGGTIKNLNIDRGFRGIVLMYPNQDVYVENVNIGVNDEVCYTINTAEGDGTHSLKVSNSRLNGWCSIGTAVKDVTFTNCTFGQGTYYTNVYGRLVKPYVDAIFDGCEFCSQCYLDLSAFVGTKVTVKNCTVNGVKITAENWTSLVAPDDTCAEGQISVELKNGSYLTAENIADYIVFE